VGVNEDDIYGVVQLRDCLVGVTHDQRSPISGYVLDVPPFQVARAVVHHNKAGQASRRH